MSDEAEEAAVVRVLKAWWAQVRAWNFVLKMMGFGYEFLRAFCCYAQLSLYLPVPTFWELVVVVRGSGGL